jgi:hypothetical protein
MIFLGKKHRSSGKAILITSTFFCVFVVFILLVTRPSLQSMAIKELELCRSFDDIKSCWSKYGNDLSDDKRFLSETRSRLMSFPLTESQVNDCKIWLPPPPTSLNVIVVPDLSKRIRDTINNPGQEANDTTILSSIWKKFVSMVRLKMNSRDRLVLDVTDDAQAAGSFRTVANDLIFDLSEHRNQSNRLFFNRIGNRFSERVSHLYNIARKEPIGADYHYFFEHRLPIHLKKSSIDHAFRNILILITDGYLESQNADRTGIWAYTGTFGERLHVSNLVQKGTPFEHAITSLKAIPDIPVHFPELEVLILEVNPRTKRSPIEAQDPGTVNDFQILRAQWTNWFRKLHIKNSNAEFFIRRNDATVITIQQVENFMEIGTE